MLSSSVTIDTDTGTSPQGLTCATTGPICVLAAPSITITATGKLAAHGTRPLALLAHAITVRGTIDVASHYNAAPGAGARLGGCTFGSLAKGAGGGRGGHADGDGGPGGNEGLAPGTGGHGGGTFVIDTLLGGCGGTHGGDGSLLAGSPDVSDGGATTGGAGGGALWLASDPGPLILGPGAIINASGAAGAGGSAQGHGGAGGGAGGLILLQAATIQLDPAAAIFANGGPGGGGAGINQAGTGYIGGQPGTDPDGPASGGTSGPGGVDGLLLAPPAAGTSPGDGGLGYPSPSVARTGQPGGIAGRGGGGGGGGAGAIRVVSTADLPGTSTNISPPPLRLQ
ncbi:MAG TPA: hypothetical protein VGD37_08520 [Kofleriaceae bacterium]|jgi:hypothetical protein